MQIMKKSILILFLISLGGCSEPDNPTHSILSDLIIKNGTVLTMKKKKSFKTVLLLSKTKKLLRLAQMTYWRLTLLKILSMLKGVLSCQV